MWKAMLAGVMAVLASGASATTTTVTGHFSSTGWTLILPDAAPPLDPLFLHYAVSYDQTQSYLDDATALTILATNIPYAVRFSFDPANAMFVLATAGNANGCALVPGSFCATGFNVLGGVPNFVAQAPADGGAWEAAQISDVSDVGPGGVPEPASWAMLVAGFGLVGAALRRRAVSAA